MQCLFRLYDAEGTMDLREMVARANEAFHVGRADKAVGVKIVSTGSARGRVICRLFWRREGVCRGRARAAVCEALYRTYRSNTNTQTSASCENNSVGGGYEFFEKEMGMKGDVGIEVPAVVSQREMGTPERSCTKQRVLKERK